MFMTVAVIEGLFLLPHCGVEKEESLSLRLYFVSISAFCVFLLILLLRFLGCECVATAMNSARGGLFLLGVVFLSRLSEETDGYFARCLRRVARSS